MSTTLITANEGIPSEEDLIVVSDLARPHLERWMAENGYIHESEAPTVTVHRMLATTPAPVVPSMEDDDFGPGECNGSGRCEVPKHVHGCYSDFGECDEPNEHRAGDS